MLPHSLAGQERLWEGYTSVQLVDRYQIKNRSQVLGMLPHNTQHGQASVLRAGSHQGTLNKYSSVFLLSSFMIQISDAEERDGTRAFFYLHNWGTGRGGTKDWADATQTEIKPTSSSWILLWCQHRSLRGKGNKGKGRMQENNLCLWKKTLLGFFSLGKKDGWLRDWDLVIPAKSLSPTRNRGNKT